MPKLRQRNNESETINEHGPPTKKPKMNDPTVKKQKKEWKHQETEGWANLGFKAE